MEDYEEIPHAKKESKKRQKQWRYKDIFDNPPKPLKKITIIKNKKHNESNS